MLDRVSRDRVVALLAVAGLPTAAPRIGAAHGFELMQMDKKVKAGSIRLVLLERLGRAAVVGRYEQQALEAVLRAHFG
jgi:3-dehydroquinate synthase